MSEHTADQATTDEESRRIERARIVAYLSHHERSALARAEEAESEESRVYQTTIAKAMHAMAEAIEGEFHWKASL